MNINPEIFKAYDIRGIYQQDMTADIAYLIGRALVAHTQARRVAVGHDMRVHSPELHQAVSRGICEQGADVYDIGLAQTPMLYQASGKLDVDAGIIITASHNPAEWNGMKLCRRQAVPIGEGSGMAEIKALVLNQSFRDAPAPGRILSQPDFSRQYSDYAQSFFNAQAASRQLKVVFDYANGMGALDKNTWDELGHYLRPVHMFEELDGNFPNHEANPLKTETLAALQARVLKEQADLGVAYDGDADRVGFIDEKGEIVPMDFITALIAREILKKQPGGLVLVDLRSSNAVLEAIIQAGGRTDLCRVGHSLIKKQMRHEGAVFAGELSGHYYFDENFKAEMSALAIIRIINLINESGQTMSQLAHSLKKYHHSGEINSVVQSKSAVLLKLKEKYSTGELNELDGIRINFPDWWFNVRASNTEPKLRLNLEAKTKKMMLEKRDELLEIIRGPIG